MKIGISIALALLFLAGCGTTSQKNPFGDCRKVNLDFDAWSAPLSEISPLFDVRIPHFEAKDIPRETALHKLASAWRAQSKAQALPVSFSAVPEAPERNITFSASDRSVRELLYIIAELSGATYIDGNLCGTIRVRNEGGETSIAPQPRRFKHLFVFDGFAK